MTEKTRLSAARLSMYVTLLVAAGVLAAGCVDAGAVDRPEEKVVTRTTRVETLVVVPTSFDETIPLTGSVEAINDATLAAQSAGTVEFIADLGTWVAKGEVVARLGQGLARATVQQQEAQLNTAQAQAAVARDNFDRLAPLYGRKIISALEFEQSRLQLEQAQASVRQSEAALSHAQSQLDDTVVRAPFTGTIERRLLESGERAGTGDQLVRLLSTQRVKVIAGVPERYAADLSVGTDVSLSFASSGVSPRQGIVTFVGAAIDPQSRTFPVEVDVANPGGHLKPAMLVELSIARHRHTDVLTVPRAALVADELGPGVYVVVAAAGGSVAERRQVVLGADAAGVVIVSAGLTVGDEVIVRGQNVVSEGDQVDVNRVHESIASIAAGRGGTRVLIP